MRSFLAGATVLAVGAVGIAHAEDSTHDSHSSHSSHDSHEALFEQAALYDMAVGTQNLIAMPGGEETTFEDESVAFMVVSAATLDEDGLEGAEEAAEAAWESYLDGDEDPTVLASGDSATPSDSIVYQISLEDPLVLVPVNVTDSGAYAVLFEHGGEEISVVVTSTSGVVLVAAVEEGVEEEEEEDDDSRATTKQWVNALVASLVVSLCSLAGLVVIVSGTVAQSINLPHAASFASGALLTASLLHIIPEAMEGLETKYPDSLHDLGLNAGLAVLAGISFGVVMHAILESNHNHHQPHNHSNGGNTAFVAADGGISTPADIAAKGERGEQSLFPTAVVGTAPMSGGRDGAVTLPPSPTGMSNGDEASLQDMMDARKGRALLDIKDLQPICWNLIIGDLVHNFADGVTIGAAFLGCSSTIGWTVTASAVLHEVPHELADFMALINGGMSMGQAFFYNFVSALSAVLGVVMILSLRETLTDAQVSFILLIGGGSFIFIALAELIPEALAAGGRATTKRAALGSQLRKLLSFVVGALIIGIPLIFDQHCEADGHSH